jgi:hypothetical protein
MAFAASPFDPLSDDWSLDFHSSPHDPGTGRDWCIVSDMQQSSDARVFCRYLIGQDPSEAIVGRYARALAATGFDPAGRDPLMLFVRRHPSLLGPLDAACALFAPRHELRQRLVLLLALLETTPEHADLFLEHSGGRLGAWLKLFRSVAGAGLLLLAGVPLYAGLRLFARSQ